MTISPGSAAAGTRPASSSSCAARRSPTDAEALVTVGAAQSNHCRMTAAAGATLGLEVHLVLSGDEPARGDGDREPVAVGAVRRATPLHRRPRPPLGRARDRPRSRSPTASPPRACGRTRSRSAAARRRGAGVRRRRSSSCSTSSTTAGSRPSTIVFTSSSGGTHAGLLAGRAAALAAGRDVPRHRRRSASPRAS